MKRTLGSSGPHVSALGLGCMSFAGTYGPGGERQDNIAVIRKAFEAGVTLFDTAEVYGPFTNEELVGEALRPMRDQVVIATKFGFDLDPATAKRTGGVNSRPDHIKAVADASLKRLCTDRIDLFYQHRVEACRSQTRCDARPDCTCLVACSARLDCSNSRHQQNEAYGRQRRRGRCPT